MNIFEDISIVILEKNEKLNLDFIIYQDIVLQRTGDNNFKVLLDRTEGFLRNLLKKVT